MALRALSARLLLGTVLLGAVLASMGGPAAAAVQDPARSIAPKPDYLDACALSGLDDSIGCLGVTLDAIDAARAREHLGALDLPASFASLPFDEQMLLVLDEERTARHLRPVAAVAPALDRAAAQGAAVDDLAPAPGASFHAVELDALAGFYNALDIDYQWLYDDGPGSGTAGCGRSGDQGCWADRHIALASYTGGGALVLGAAEDPTGDTQTYDKGGPSMALVLAETTGAPEGGATWSSARSLEGGPTLRALAGPPSGESETGIADPPHTEPPQPDYTSICASSGIDDSPGCIAAVLAAINTARAKEGVKPMVLPAAFATLAIPEQLFVVINLERVDRGLAPFVGMSAGLDANAQKGADRANDPPSPSNDIGDDEEWAGGSVNGLDADYGWMYDDGRGSGNLDCPRSGGPGCWGHRHGILDNFGTVGAMVMGTAFDPTGDNAASGWAGGTSMAATLAAVLHPPSSYVYTWAESTAP